MFSMHSPVSGTPVRTCQRCGKPLSPNEVYCDNCGVYNGLPQANSFTGYAAPQQPSYPNNYGSTTQSSQFSHPGSFYNAPQQQWFAQSASPVTGGLQPGSMNRFPSGFEQMMPQPPAQKRKSSRGVGLIIGMSILVIVLISAVVLGYAFLTNKADKTSSKELVSTPTPTPTPLFADSFANNSNGWDLTSSPGTFSVQVGSGKMVLEDDNNKLLWEIVPGKTFGNFTLTVDALLSKGDQNNGYGIYIRGGSSQDSELGTYYRFELYGDGTYAIFKGVLDGSGKTQSKQLVNYSASSAIQKQGMINHITIVAKGQSMTFIINGQTLNTITDNNYKSGSVALFVSNLANSPPVAQATFTHFAIYPVS